MAPIHVHTTVETDGEIRLRGLPLQKGQEADVLIVVENAETEAVLAVLANDPAWAWLRDEAEDVYTEQDAH